MQIPTNVSGCYGNRPVILLADVFTSKIRIVVDEGLHELPAFLIVGQDQFNVS